VYVCRGKGGLGGSTGTQITCFTSTKVQILTQKALVGWGALIVRLNSDVC
jgi:hypothetical protein